MMKNKAPKQKSNPFRQAVEATPDVASGYRPGLQALLKKDSKKIELADPTKCEGSLDIDTCTTAKYPQANRWDYALSYKAQAYFVEVHSAETGEVSTVLKKLQWLKDWLETEAPEIKKMKAGGQAFFWLQSGRFDILPGSPQSIKLASARLRPIPKLVLK